MEVVDEELRAQALQVLSDSWAVALVENGFKDRLKVHSSGKIMLL